jgi:putative SOS response-associated peptidase YedK
MCSHYQAVSEAKRLEKYFGVRVDEPIGKVDLWPGYLGSFIRRHPHADLDDEAVPPTECLPGLFGLVPHWSADTKTVRHTFNARSETAAQKPSFRDAWKRSQHCIIPADAIYEPDWRSGKAIATRISRVDGEPMGIAGLWSSWKSPKGEAVLSFTMLTINAQEHALMQQFHKPADEKRMVVVLPPDRYQDWLEAKPEQSMEFLQMFPAERLRVSRILCKRRLS